MSDARVNSPADASGDIEWAPRREQERRLRHIEAQLSLDGRADPDIKVERAVLLAALGRREGAYHAFLDILRHSPGHFGALNEFGNLLTANGAIDAACRVYAEAIASHPHNPVAHINLGNLLRRQQKFDEAIVRFERALAIDPESQPALQGLGAVYSDLGQFAEAQACFRKGFRGRAIATLPYRGTASPRRLLHLVSSGGGNIPIDAILDDRTYLTTVIVADHLEPGAELPPHDLVFNAVGDADLCQPALQAAIALLDRTAAPVINHPRSILNTGRVENARLLGRLQDVTTPRTISVSRAVLLAVDAEAMLAGQGLAFPLLVRASGFHTGKHFALVESRAELEAKLEDIPGDDLLVIAYLNARGVDGNARKYRVMFVDGALHPLHLAISRHWKVHYFTSDMADQSDARAEEAAFLSNMEAVIGARAVAALERIRDALGLDYGGVDFAIDSEGQVLLFEANATMVVLEPPSDPRWDYRRVAVKRILGAVTDMMARRAALGRISRGG